MDPDRRRFLRGAAMTMATTFSISGEAAEREPRELAALVRAREWINSPPLSAAELRGRVVLVDFCTYTCINWLRTLPYRRAWAQKYGGGAVLVGVHTPEFPFERDSDNVRRALRQMNVGYPIAIDNDYAIWRAFRNHYWPALYFVDGRGRVRDRQFGEGEYERCERVLQRLLGDAGVAATGVGGTGLEAAPAWDTLGSPENYLGSERTQHFASPGGIQRGRRLYAAPARPALNQWGLAGAWTVGPEAVTAAAAGSRIVCRFRARDLHLVMAPPAAPGPARFRVSLDGQAPGAARGGDVDEAGLGRLVEPRLYQLIRQPGPIDERRFEIEFLDAGAAAYAFTFG
jgi:thiol-disulfide isomerase/thioredoxin